VSGSIVVLMSSSSATVARAKILTALWSDTLCTTTSKDVAKCKSSSQHSNINSQKSSSALIRWSLQDLAVQSSDRTMQELTTATTFAHGAVPMSERATSWQRKGQRQLDSRERAKPVESGSKTLAGDTSH
jgi:hypothetical protein